MIEVLLDRPFGRTDTMPSVPLMPESPDRDFSATDRFAGELVNLFKLLSDETRLKILLVLSQSQEMHVRALCELLEQSQPAVSHHLALLRDAGLIDRRREGKHNFYYLVPGKFEHLLDLVFAGADKSERQLRFKDYVLSYAPA